MNFSELLVANVNLYDLNLLARHLTMLTEDQWIGMEKAMLKIKQEQHFGAIWLADH